MSYDKDSLLAGIAVGKQINGFWTGGVSIASADFGSLSDITVKSQAVTYVEKPAEGFYGIGSVTVLGDENLKPENIRQGVTILDVVGTYAFRPQTKSITITSNGTTTLSPDYGYDGLSQVRIIANIPDAVTLQSKYVIPSASSQTIRPDNGYDGLSYVTIEGDSDLKPENIRGGVTLFGVTGTFQEVKLISKSVRPGTETQIIYPGTGYDALSSVTVEGDSDLVASNIKAGVTIFGVVGTFQDIKLTTKTITPGVSTQTVRPDSGYDGFSYVNVLGDPDLISTNIREGVEIFGVRGSYSNLTKYQEKTVTPSNRSIRVTPDSGYNALAAVTVNTDTDLKAENIRNGIDIFGVTGNFRGNLEVITVYASQDEQHIFPTDEYDGFSSVIVAPVSGGGGGGTIYPDGDEVYY